MNKKKLPYKLCSHDDPNRDRKAKILLRVLHIYIFIFIFQFDDNKVILKNSLVEILT